MSTEVNAIPDMGLYVHIPFCMQKCLYCDFASSTMDEAQMSIYVAALVKELRDMRAIYSDFRPSTVFFGGGTPSLLPLPMMETIIDEIARFGLSKDVEMSLESNPGTITTENLTAYRRMGFNRISMGVQAVQDRLLKMMGRAHRQRETILGIEAIQKVGFDNFNLDLMFGLPTQTLAEWEESLSFAIEANSPHLSCYSLKIEEGTPWGELYKQNRIEPADDVLDRQMYHRAVEMLGTKGIKRYEISNFAKEGFACRHNLLYWERGSYIGVGLAAHSFIDGKRFGNTESFASYVNGVTNGNKELTEEADISIDEALFETMILGLRLDKGVLLPSLFHEFGTERIAALKPIIAKLEEQQLVIQQNERVQLTDKGFDLANIVFSAFG